MATPSDIHAAFILPLSTAFGSPPGQNDEAFFDALADHLASFTVLQLTAAARSITATRVARTFPTIAECLAECRKTPAALVQQTRGVIDDEGKYLSGYAARKAAAEAEARRAAEAMCDCDLGRDAAYDRWLPALIDFAVKRGRLPGTEEIAGVRAISWRANETAARVAILGKLRAAIHLTSERRVFGALLPRREDAA